MKHTIKAPEINPEIVIGGREQLFHLLAEAAEVEHTLMCCYLYAAFSLKRRQDAGLDAQEGGAVEDWRKVIMSVAMDEMVHLVLVANLSVAIGGRPHFGRPNFPVSSGYFPADMVLKLAPFNLDTLDHFIYLERPKGVKMEDGSGFEPPTPYQREEAFHGLMPSIQDYDTVGALYEALRENLCAVSARIGNDQLFIGPASCQIGHDAVQLDGIATCVDLESALAAIDTIVEQGEGSPGEREDSHYQRFRSIRDQFRRLVSHNPRFEPAWPAAQNPVMRRPPAREEKVYVDEPHAARVLDFGNACYGMLLQCLVQAFGHARSISGRQACMVEAAIALMHVIVPVASVLARMPASLESPGINAGLSFTMLRGVEPHFRGIPESILMAERLNELAAGVATIQHLVPGLEQAETVLHNLARLVMPQTRHA